MMDNSSAPEPFTAKQRAGSGHAQPDFELIDPSKEGAAAEHRAHRKALRALSARWGEQHQKRVAELAQELCSASPNAGGDERAIYRLVATSTAISELLGKAQLQLAERVGRLVDEHKALLAVAKALREITQVQSSTMRSVEQLYAAVGTLRAQRRLVEHQERRSWHELDGGASLPHARRDPPARSATPN